MPFNLSKTHRNDRELFVLKKIERFQVNEYMGRSNWARYYFDNYKDAIKKFRDLKKVKSEIKDYVRDHYKYYGFYPYDVEVGDVVYTYEQYMDILSMTV